MEGVIKEATINNNYHLLREVLLSMDFFSEIDPLLIAQEAEQFYSSFSVVKLNENHTLDLHEGVLYFFVNAGSFISRKAIKQFDQRSKVIRSKRKNHTKIEQALTPNSIDKIDIEAESIANIQNWFSQCNRVIKCYCASRGAATILLLESKTLSSRLVTKLKHYFAEKFKMISKFNIFKEISKTILQNYISQFIYTRVAFNEYLYSSTKRSEFIFFVKKGEIQLETAPREKFIVQPPILLGDQKMDERQCAKCVSDYCIAYRLKKTTLNEIMRENFHEFEKDTEKYTKSSESCLRTQYLRERKINKEGSLNETTYMTPNPPPKYSQASSETESTDKKHLLKRYFSNFINEKYDQFYEKKTNLLKGMGIDKDQPILYMMKTLSPKIPDYQGLNRKLKMARIRKILDYKNSTEKKPSISLFKLNTTTHKTQPNQTFSKYRLKMKLKHRPLKPLHSQKF